MTSLAAFEKTLKEVVGAKRVSASKMTSLTESALKSMDNDTQLVSILYRTHKSLPTPGKVSSLYAFDALARAARSKVTKYNLTGDVNSEKGNCATFLLKIEGVLDGLFQDMVVTGTPETREKAKKILDIWTKSSTFSPKVLMRLKDVVKDAEQENGKAVTTPPVGDPRTANQVSTPTPPIVTPQAPAPTATPVDPTQSTLLALLHQAANGGLNTLTASSAGAFPPNQTQLDPAQFALLQQLAQTAKQGNGSQPPFPGHPPAQSANSGPPAFGGSSQPQPPYHEKRYENNRVDPRLGRYENAPRGRGRGDSHDDQMGYRGNSRGTGFRGRGRGNFEDRDRFNNRDGYKSPPTRPRHSRSRSPPGRYGAGARRDAKPYSPPQRPTLTSMQSTDKASSSRSADPFPVPVGPQKDEFGRDIRPQSPGAVEENSAQPPRDLPSSVDPAVPSAIARSQIPSVPQQSSPAPAANTSSQINSAPAADKTPSQPGLDKFDMSTFDFTAPSSWEALGKMWQVTYGYLPSQEELMQLVMSGGLIAGAAAAGMIPGQYPGAGMGQQGWQQFGGLGAGASNQGAGGPAATYDQGRLNQPQRVSYPNNGYQQTDAIVLGGGDDSTGRAMQVDYPSVPSASPISPSSGEGGPGGRMQRVGEKWVFVRDGVAT